MSALGFSNLIHLFTAQQVSSVKIVCVCTFLPRSHKNLCCKAQQTHKSSLDQRNHWREISPCGSLLPHGVCRCLPETAGAEKQTKGSPGVTSAITSPASPTAGVILGDTCSWWALKDQDTTRCYQHISAEREISSSGYSLSPQQAARCTGPSKGHDGSSAGCSG